MRDEIDASETASLVAHVHMWIATAPSLAHHSSDNPGSKLCLVWGGLSSSVWYRAIVLSIHVPRFACTEALTTPVAPQFTDMPPRWSLIMPGWNEQDKKKVVLSSESGS